MKNVDNKELFEAKMFKVFCDQKEQIKEHDK